MDGFLRAFQLDLVIWLACPLLFLGLIGYVLVRVRGGRNRKEAQRGKDARQ
jgi:hypothetical protein